MVGFNLILNACGEAETSEPPQITDVMLTSLPEISFQITPGLRQGWSNSVALNLTHRGRRDVYVIGAGFSFDLGYPLTSGLLVNIWNRLKPASQQKLGMVIRFHHPYFDPLRNTSFPDIEQLLTEISVNEDMFDASRPAEGNFKQGELTAIREELLNEVAAWFHELFPQAATTPWLASFAQRLVRDRAAVISFNWDLLLDHQLFSSNLTPKSYGLGPLLGDEMVLMKPHGSLNWYNSRHVTNVSADKRATIFQKSNSKDHVEAFLYPRQINSKVGRQYSPLIVPPTFLKDFRLPIFKRIWRRCTTLLSTARNIYFLGYSLPAADLQAQFILRCGFHNQIEGRLSSTGRRTKPTGAAKVVIVNPDPGAARRIEAVAGRDVQCDWVVKRVKDWLDTTT